MCDRKWCSRLFTLMLVSLLGWLFASDDLMGDVLAQTVPTATPDAAGVIYVEVLPNDSLWGIASQAGLTLQELLDYNGLTENTIIQPGQLLIIGYGTPPPTPTVELPTPTATATKPPPTPTATALPPPRTAICMIAFDDLNRDGVWDREEPLKAAVAFTIFNDESVVANYISDGVSEPYCLEGLAPGDYKITRSVGRDEVLTTDGDWALTLARGTILDLEFGSFVGADVATVNVESTRPPNATRSVAENAAMPDTATQPANEPDSSGALLIGFAVLMALALGVGALLVLRRWRTQPK